MFCFQCQEALNNTGCTQKGVCGKTDEVASLQDLLILITKGLSFWSTRARQLGLEVDESVDRFVLEALFITVTNVNFDPDDIDRRIDQAFDLRDALRKRVTEAESEPASTSLPDAATVARIDSRKERLDKAAADGVLASEDPDIRSLRELVTYGIKGIAAYADHAYVLNHTDPKLYSFMQEALAATLDDSLSVDHLVQWVLRTGDNCVSVMALLDEANTSTYGHPEPTQVSTGTKAGPAILVSGHDLLDMEEILKQSEGRGINVYTHGEMLPALAYPELKKYDHFKGNYGSGWWNQQKDFDAFNGAIVMTTNCLQKPRNSYQHRLFNTGLVGWPGVAHIPNRIDGQPKDFSPVIDKALSLKPGLEKTDGITITIGFARNTLLDNADAILDAINSGKLKRFVVMAGCDGRQNTREYFTEVAKQLPQETAILTAGCAKYRYNKLQLGDIDGIPRVIDAGQCNDSYSLAYTALKLKEILNLDDINDLPISYDIAWYEQKAITVLLALLSLGVKGIRLGPTLPAFLSENIARVLVEQFDIKPVTTPQADIEAMMQGN